MTTSEVPRGHPLLVPVGKGPRLRASDTDRAATVGVLQDAVARGLLSYAEGDERMAAAFGAHYVDELPLLTADLPAPPPPTPQAPGWRAVGGMLATQVRHELRATAAAGVRSRRFRVAVLLALVLIGMVLAAGGLFAHDYGQGGRSVPAGPGYHGGFGDHFPHRWAGEDSP
jgi:Domain of unknown function (DUF1707)